MLVMANPGSQQDYLICPAGLDYGHRMGYHPVILAVFLRAARGRVATDTRPRGRESLDGFHQTLKPLKLHTRQSTACGGNDGSMRGVPLLPGEVTEFRVRGRRLCRGKGEIAMKLLATALLTAALLFPCGSLWAAIEVFQGYQFEDQPFPGYVSAKVSIDTLGNLVINSATRDDGSSGKIGTPWPVGTASAESIGIAQLLATGPFASIHARVFDSRATDNNGLAVVMEDDGGKILDFGARYTSGIGWIAAREYSGSAWTYQRNHDRNSGDKYYTMDFAQNPDGTIAISCTEWFSNAETPYTWTTTQSYGSIRSIYLTASSSTRVARDYKYSEFSCVVVPEPSSLVALACAITGLTGCTVRRRRF